MSSRTDNNRMLSEVLKWQEQRKEDRGLETWTADEINYEIGIVVDGLDTVSKIDDSNLDEKTDIVAHFKEGRYGSYYLKFEEGQYQLTRASSKSKKSDEDEDEDEENETEGSE